jgi:perosamine synthetase
LSQVRKINIAQPDIGAEERDAVLNVMSTGGLAQGPKVAELEAEFAEFIGTKNAVAVNSGTAALHAALLAYGVGPGDEVITSSFSFIASGNSVLYTGARPVFVDVAGDFNIDCDLIESAINEKTKAIMPVHLFGQPCDMDRIMALAAKYGLAVVEDTCQSHGAEFKGKKAGAFGAGCFSFYPTKNMTTGEGGMITTDDDNVAEQCRLIRAHGMKVRYYHDTLGYNYRMTDLGAAIGVVQLGKLDSYNKRRGENAARLTVGIAGIPGLITPDIGPDRSHVFHQYTVRVTSNFNITRDDLVAKLAEKGIGSGVYYPVPIHKQKVYSDLGYDVSLPVTEQFAAEVLSLPVHPLADSADIDYIVKTIKELANG